ncbi:MAG: RteC domain-containing protein [Flavobacteriaceae bacterium]
MKKREYVTIVEAFNKEIKKIERDDFLSMDKIHEAIILSRLKLSKLKKYTILFPFENQEEEIAFFKSYKGSVLTTLIYYEEVRNFEINSPELSITSKKEFILRQEQKIKKFFKKHESLVQYISLNLTNLDTLFFTLKPINESWCVCNESYHTDPGFYTNHDLLLAKIRAFKRLLAYLKTKYNAHDNFLKYGIPLHSQSNIKWTGSKTELVELIYGLHSSKVINNGNTDIKKITQFFEKSLDMDLSDVYKIYSEIKTRQKTPTKFLEEMTINLREEIEKTFR